MADALTKALDECEALLERERRDGADEALVRSKEEAVQHLADALAAQQGAPVASEELGTRLTALLANNRFSLKWSGLRAKLAGIGQPKQPQAPGGAVRPRIDLVH